MLAATEAQQSLRYMLMQSLYNADTKYYIILILFIVFHVHCYFSVIAC